MVIDMSTSKPSGKKRKLNDNPSTTRSTQIKSTKKPEPSSKNKKKKISPELIQGIKDLLKKIQEFGYYSGINVETGKEIRIPYSDKQIDWYKKKLVRDIKKTISVGKKDDVDQINRLRHESLLSDLKGGFIALERGNNIISDLKKPKRKSVRPKKMDVEQRGASGGIKTKCEKVKGVGERQIDKCRSCREGQQFVKSHCRAGRKKRV